MTDKMLWSLDEAAHQLGGVSSRTVRRMIERGDIPAVRIGRRITVPADAARRWVDENMQQAHNIKCAGKAVLGDSTWQSVKRKGVGTASIPEKNPRIIGRPTSIKAAKELGALLGSK